MTATEATQGLLLPQALDARGIVDILRRHHSPPDRWLFLTELMPGTGTGGGERRIDAWAMHCWPSAGYARLAYEVKVARSDFLAELRQPRKRRWAMLYSHQFYFVTPPGLAKVEEIPPDCGLIEVDRAPSLAREIGSRMVGDREWFLNYVVAAPERDTPPPSWRFLAAVTRQARDMAVRERDWARAREGQG